MTTWCGLVFWAANPQWLNLPGEGVLSNYAILIAAYIPAGLALGTALSWFIGRGQVRAVVACAGLIVLGVWHVPLRCSDVRESPYALVTRPDLHAAAWIEENIPQNARFMVNSFFAYGGTDIVGSDGGWWLPLLAQRQTTLPPLTYETERGPRPDYLEWINALSALVQDKGMTHPDVLRALAERGVTHIYIGQRQGRVNYSGPHVLIAEQLLADSNFEPVYHRDRVWIFRVRSSNEY